MFTFSDEARRTFEAMPIPLAYYQRVDGNVRATLVSDGLCEMMGTTREKLLKGLNKGLTKQVHPEDVGRLSRISREFEQGLCGYDVIYRGKYGSDREYHTIHSIAKKQLTPDGEELALFVYTDVSESEGQIRMLAESYEMLQKDRFYNDSVTGLLNVNFLVEFWPEILPRYLRDGKPATLFYFDVTGLRYYNSQYGIAAGDELLRLVGDVLQHRFPEAMTIRGVEDHFVVVTAHMDDAALAEAMREVNARVRIGAEGNTAGVRAGVCELDAETTVAEALDRGRQALRQIGTDLNLDHMVYSQKTDENYWNQRYFLESFGTALEKEWIKVYYQVIVRLKTGKAAALEALARWVDPQWGLIMPGDFLPVLERHHLLYKLDLYMVEQVCKEIPERNALGLPLIPVSVNFSAQDFDHVDVVRALNDIFERYEVSRDLIMIEITEQDLARGTENFRQQLRELRENGYRIWIDDFGSGYSSLNVFSRYRADLTKFDLDFLRRLDENHGANRHIMEAMTGVFRKLGLSSLAEGVETEEQLEFLKEIGCDFGQGYYFYKPQSLAQIAFKIKNGQPFFPCESEEDRKLFLSQIDARWEAANADKAEGGPEEKA